MRMQHLPVRVGGQPDLMRVGGQPDLLRRWTKRKALRAERQVRCWEGCGGERWRLPSLLQDSLIQRLPVRVGGERAGCVADRSEKQGEQRGVHAVGGGKGVCGGERLGRVADTSER